MSQQITYVQGTELPDIQVTWKDSAGVALTFTSTPHTFSFRIASTPAFTKGTLGGAQVGITRADTAPNVTIAFSAGDLDSIVPGTYRGQLWARRTSDSKDRQPLPFDFIVEPAN